MPTVLIGSEPIRHQPGPFRTLLVSSGFDIIDPKVGGKLSTADLLELLPGCDAVIAGGEAYTAEIIAACPRLRVIARTGVGYDEVDVKAASSRGIVVTTTPGANHEAVAEHTMALLLCLAKNLQVQTMAIRQGIWKRSPLPTPLRGRTIGLVGLGRIGRSVARLALAFGMRVVASDPAGVNAGDAGIGIEAVSFLDLLNQSDVVSLHAPMLESTRGLIDRSAFERMRAGALLINTARGGLIVEADLVDALRSGRIAGAGLDVFDSEPPGDDHAIYGFPNVVMTPHLAGLDTLSMTEMARMAAQCVTELHQGQWPADCVINPETAPSWRW